MRGEYIRSILLGGLAFLVGSGCVPIRDYVNESSAELPANTCSDGEYDYDTRCVDFTRINPEAAMKGVYKISTFCRFKEIDGKRPKMKLWNGSGILLENGYILTARHILEPKPEDLEEKAENGESRVLEVDSLRYALWENDNLAYMEEAAKSSGFDSAILKIKEGEKNNLPYFPFKIGNSDNLRVGNKVYVVGDKDGLGISLDEAIISKNYGVDPGMFEISTKLERGNSGGAIIALRDGTPELVGIIALRGGGITRINEALEEFKKILELKE